MHKQVQVKLFGATSIVKGYIAVIALLLFAAFLVSTLHPSVAQAQTKRPAYSCGGNPGTGHCYATAVWDGRVTGASTNISVTHMVGGDYFALQDLWLIDRNIGLPENCQVDPTFPNGVCWVEAGIIAYGSNSSKYPNSERWFWADLRPGSHYYDHPATGTLHSQDYSLSALMDIFQSGTNQYTISINNNNSGTGVTGLIAYSTGNTMRPDAIRAGLEISGTGGWQVPITHFTQNFWRALDNNWHPQTSEGAPQTPNIPADGYWNIPPASNGSNNGGDWVTCITGAGC